MKTRTRDQDVFIVAMGAAMRILRNRAGIAQERLAYEAGVDRSHMSAIERGEHAPTLYTLAKILPLLGVGFTELGMVLDAELDRQIKAPRRIKKAGPDGTYRSGTSPPVGAGLAALLQHMMEFLRQAS